MIILRPNDFITVSHGYHAQFPRKTTIGHITFNCDFNNHYSSFRNYIYDLYAFMSERPNNYEH